MAAGGYRGPRCVDTDRDADDEREGHNGALKGHSAPRHHAVLDAHSDPEPNLSLHCLKGAIQRPFIELPYFIVNHSVSSVGIELYARAIATPLPQRGRPEPCVYSTESLATATATYLHNRGYRL
jgi:hypothetical protein